MTTNPVRSVKARRRQVREEVIEDILAIARKMMRQDGVAALSFNAIARQLGIQPPSLYTYFESKNAIYDELFRRGFLEFGQWMEQRPGQEGSARDTLQSAMERYMRFAQQNPDLFQLMFQRPVPDFTPSDVSMATSLAELEKAQQQFAAVLSRGDLQVNMPIEEARDLFIALQHGLTELHLANNPDLPVGEGRFGKLIPNAVQLLMSSWTKSETKE